MGGTSEDSEGGVWDRRINRLGPDRLLRYKRTDEGDLHLHLFNPLGHSSVAKCSVVVFFFGGGWRIGTPRQFYPQAERLAQKGMVAICAEYRIESKHGTTPRECVKDGKSALRWIRKNADMLGVDPLKIVAGGGSAGGHIAAATALLDGFDESCEDVSIDCRPAALVLFNPVIDNGPGGFGHDRMLSDWSELSPLHNIKEGCPPVVLFLGDQDELVPVSSVVDFQEGLNKVGTRCDLHVFEGEQHGFFNDSKFDETYQLSESFLASLGF